MPELKLLEISEMPLDEIADQLKTSRKELIDLRMKFASRQLDNPSLLRKKRKEIARLLTACTQKLKSGEVEDASKEVKESKKRIKGIRKEKQSKEEKEVIKKSKKRGKLDA